MGHTLKSIDRRVHYRDCDQPGSYGVVTAADSRYALELELLYRSLRRHHRVPLCVWDLGLPPRLVSRLVTDPLVTVLQPSPALCDTFPDHWQAWWKPLFIRDCPYELALWIDADCVVADSIMPLFGLLSECPVLTAEQRHREAARNPPELYADTAVTPDDRVLNSGVVGLRRGRDEQLLRDWLELVEHAARDEQLRTHISWWDQGALLWVLHKHRMTHLIMQQSRWNRPAKWQLYNPDEDPLEAVVRDNPGAAIIHYAGLKLSSLLNRDDGAVRGYLSDYRRAPTRRIFCLGLEAAGGALLTRWVRDSCPSFGWVEHLARPSLAPEGALAVGKAAAATGDLAWKLTQYDRDDCQLVFESNHHLGPLADRVWAALRGDCKFILIWRDPVSLVEARLRAGCHWPALRHTLPVMYQQFLLDVGADGDDSNLHRPRPAEGFSEMGVLDLQLWDIHHHLMATRRALAAVPGERILVVDLADLEAGRTDRLRDFIGADLLRPAAPSPDWPDLPPAVANWAWAMASGNAGKIHKHLDEVFAAARAGLGS